MESENNLENVLNEIIDFIKKDDDREDYIQHCAYVKDTISNKLREVSPFFWGFELEDSYGDNVKNSKSDEFHEVFYIKFPEQSLIVVTKDPKVPSNVLLNFARVIKKMEKEKQDDNLRCLMNMLNKKFLDLNKLQDFIQSDLNNVIEDMEYRITLNGKIATLRFERQGHSHTIHVWRSCDFKYSIDFVPGIVLNNDQSLILINGQWELIPKPSNSLNSLKLSNYQYEHDIIDRKQLKNALRMMIKFRDVKMHMSQIKSYCIKTLFLLKAEKEPVFYWEKPLQEIIIDMFKELEESLCKKYLPYYWDRKLNLYNKIKPTNICKFFEFVKSTRMMLEEAAINLTVSQEKLIYHIFLTKEEFKQLKNPHYKLRLPNGPEKRFVLPNYKFLKNTFK